MPRTLPWLAQDTASAVKKASSSSSLPPPPKRKRAYSQSEDLVDSNLNPISVPPRRERKQLARSPSTSPPLAPPEVEYMREGYNADDTWMMVEDEFFSTAQSFTQHIHHAEYVRLEKLAKTRGEGTLQAIARPTDGRTAQSIGTKLKTEAAEKARQAEKGLQGLKEESDNDGDNSDDFMFDPHLAGLMKGSQRLSQDLTKMAKTKSNTRAAAGFGKSPRKPKPAPPVSQAYDYEEHDDEDSDDLDRHMTRRHKTATAGTGTTIQSELSNVKCSTSGTKAKQPTSGFFKNFTGSQPQEKCRTPADRGAASKSSGTDRTKNAEEDPSIDAYAKRRQASMNFLAKRRAAREAAKQKSEQEQGKEKRWIDVDIPTFAIV